MMSLNLINLQTPLFYQRGLEMVRNKKTFFKGKPPTCHSPSQLVHPEGWYPGWSIQRGRGYPSWSIQRGGYPSWSIQPWLFHPGGGYPSWSIWGSPVHHGEVTWDPQCIMERSHGTPPQS